MSTQDAASLAEKRAIRAACNIWGFNPEDFQ